MNVAAGDGESLALDQAFDSDSLYALRAAVAAHGSQAGLSDGRTRDLVLAVHELAANAVRHGAGQGRLRLWAAADAVRCEVTDEGAPGEADAARWQAEPGHGLWLVRRIADSASVRSGASGTVAAVTFRRARSWPPDDAG
jgi:anti-sigma regulatory factor (Ser/Thr protein kinase)